MNTSKTIWKEVAPGQIECLTHGERFRLDGGTCAACVVEAIGTVEFMPVTITGFAPIPYNEDGSRV